MKNFSSRMKASSRHSSDRGRVTKILIAIAIAIFVLFLFRALIGGVVATVTTPFYHVRSWFVESSATVPSYFRDRKLLTDRIHELEREIGTLTGRNTSLSRLQDENERLRSLLGMDESERIGAGVLARPPHIPYDSLLIDQGASDGVREGAVVYHGEDRAIGYVSKTYTQSSLISLFTAPGVESTVYILGPDIYTNAYGEGGGVMRVSVPQGIDLAEGDMVVLPSLRAGVVGTVDAVESVATKPEQNGFVTFDTSIQSIQFVSISKEVPESVTFDAAREIIRDVRSEFLRVDVPANVIVETGTSTRATSTETGTSSVDVIEEE